MQWFNNLPVQIQAALIGAFIALLGILLRDLFFKKLQEKRETKRSARAIFRKYADPLTTAATNLLWRLQEIFLEKGRGTYLKEPITNFEHYKKISTLYRLASLLGWIRAYRRELTFLRSAVKPNLNLIQDAIDSLESSLADGHHIEHQRLEDLARLWSLPISDDEDKKSYLAIALNNFVKRKLQSSGVAIATDLTEQDQLELCEEVAKIICDYLKINPPSSSALSETREQVIQRLAIIEAWIYRDWQTGIGDLMIQTTNYGDRAFEVIGFKEFESMSTTGTEEQTRWLARLSNIFDDLDISRTDRFDARIPQLKSVTRATAQLVSALGEVHSRHHTVSEDTLIIARKILKEFKQKN